jgi:O-antigen/teichoic acid export membrane protein
MNDAASAAIPDDIERKIAKSAAWMVVSRFAVRGIGLVSTVILARLLRPEDFGLVALAAAVVGGLDALSQCGFDMALFQTGAATRAHYDTVWTLTVWRNAAIAILLAAFAGPVALFFGDARLHEIMYFFAGGILIEGLFNVGIVDFRKELDFHREFAFQTIVKLVAFVATVTLAFLWRNYWALIIGGLSGKLTGLVLSYTMHPHRPRFSLGEWRSLISFSKWMLLTNIGYFFSGRIETFTIGRVVDMHAVGMYEVASEISNLPTGEIVWPIQRALYPGYAKVGDDRERLAKNYLDGVAIIMMIALPAALGIVVTAQLIIDLFLGPKWADALPLLQILSIAGMLRIGYANTGPVVLALGRARLLSYLSILNVALTIGLVIPGTLIAGTKGAAYGILGASLATLAIYVATTLRLTHISVLRLCCSLWRTLAAGLVMALSVAALLALLPQIGFLSAAVLELPLAVIIGALLYVGVHLGLWMLAGSPSGPERVALAAIAPYFRRFRP